MKKARKYVEVLNKHEMDAAGLITSHEKSE